MAEELNTNPTATAADAPVTQIETPATPPIIEPQPLTSPAPEPASTEAMADKPIVAPAPVSPAPVPPASPAPIAPIAETGNAIQRLLIKAKEKIQFRKQAKLEKIVVFAKAQGGITNDQAQKLLHVSDATATRYLAELVRTGRLRRVSAKGRGARYAPAQ